MINGVGKKSLEAWMVWQLEGGGVGCKGEGLLLQKGDLTQRGRALNCKLDLRAQAGQFLLCNRARGGGDPGVGLPPGVRTGFVVQDSYIAFLFRECV